MLPNLTKLIKNTQKISQIKIFDSKKISLFVTGIIVISILSSSVSAFSNGFNQKQVLIASDPNTLIITQPGASTPVTSRVYSSLGKDLEFVNGIQQVYPETLSLCSVKQSIATVHGVSNDFFQTLTGLATGQWLYNNSNDNDAESLQRVVAGSVIAKKLNLKVGETIIVSSTVTDVYLSLTVSGILKQQQTPIDEQLVVSLPIGRLLSSLQPHEVSFLRVYVDLTRINKVDVQSLLEQQHSLSISVLHNKFREYDNLHHFFTVSIKTTDNILVKQFECSSTLNDSVLGSSKLPFGRYNVEIQSPYLNTTLNTSIVLTEDQEIDFPDIKLQYLNTTTKVLDEVHLKLTNQYKEPIQEKIAVHLQSIANKNISYTAETDESGEAVFNHIETGLYNISAIVNNKKIYSYNFISEENSYIDVFFSTGEINEDSTGEDTFINLNKWHGYRQYSVDYSNNFADSFFTRTLNIVKLSVLSLTCVVFVLSLMSITTATKYPLLTSVSTIKSLKLIGTSNLQILFMYISQLTFLGFIGTVIGILLSYALLHSLDMLSSISIAGIIILPKFDWVVIGVVSVTNTLMIVLTSYKKMQGVLRKFQREGIPI